LLELVILHTDRDKIGKIDYLFGNLLDIVVREVKLGDRANLPPILGVEFEFINLENIIWDLVELKVHHLDNPGLLGFH